jgi:hypothetical protein
MFCGDVSVLVHIVVTLALSKGSERCAKPFTDIFAKKYDGSNNVNRTTYTDSSKRYQAKAQLNPEST